MNTVEILGPGIISTGGGWETMDSVQVMFHTKNYGSTWTENTHDGLAPWNKSIAFSDSLNGYGVGYDGRIIKTDDAGLNWGWAVFPVNRDLNKIVYVDNGIFFVAGGNKANDSIQTILKSNDNGSTWNVIYDTLGPWLKSVFFIDTLKGFAVGESGVILSTANGGNTWATVPSPLQRNYNAITFLNADTGFIAGGIPVDSCRRTILQTVDGGTSWTVLVDETGGILNDISFADSLVGYVLGDSATVLKTTDGGMSWMPVTVDTNLSGTETFNAVKFYNKNFGAVAGKAGFLYVYQDRLPDVFTLGLSQIGSTDATLRGGINTHNKSVQYSFVYSTNKSFSFSLSRPVVSVQNDSLLLVSENIQGLLPDTTYYYFLKGTTSADTVSGDTLSFFTGNNPPFVFETHDATGVGSWGGSMNGFIDNLPDSADLYFEYGLSPFFGSQVVPIPGSVNDNSSHSIQAFVNNLQASKQYFFRLKGVSAAKTYYGDTKIFQAVSLPWVSTGNATVISSDTVQLNGNVSNNGLPTAIKFEHGLSSLYGNEAIAFPDSVSGTNNVSASCSLTNLSLGLTYHFRLKAINANGTSYGTDKTFIMGAPGVFTLPVTNLGLNSAQLNGVVNANGFPTENKFEFGTTTSYGNEVSAIPDSSTGNVSTNISFLFSGLFQDSVYHYRVKATNVNGTTYGNDVTFMVDTPPSVQTLMATEISFYSVRLNGSIDAGGIPSAVNFEYGTTTAYGNEISAIPDSVSGSGIISAYALLSGLTPNTTYHYRIKGTNSFTARYGNDMIFFTGLSEIPNADFEIWDSLISDFPDEWGQLIGNILQESPGCDGNKAIKIQNTAEGGMSAITMGYLGEGPVGTGVPFNARPDSLLGCFNYDIDINDTAWIALIFSKDGNPAGVNIFGIAGNSGGDFVDLAFPIQYSVPDVPDSLIMLISSSNFNQQTHSPDNWIIADDIHFAGTSLNIPNNSFENWHIERSLALTGWNYERMGVIPIDTVNIVLFRTSDVVSGNYAVKLTTHIQENGKTMGQLSAGNNNLDKFPVNGRHQNLTGYYKYFPENNDTMSITVIMYNNGVQIGTGTFKQKDTISSYNPFIIDISYFSTIDIPDSASILIKAYSDSIHGKSVVYIDNLNFDGFLYVSSEPTPKIANQFDFNIYPNPFSGQATVTFHLNRDENISMRLFDISGKQVSVVADGKYKKGNYRLDLSASGLQGGFYICVISTDSGNFFRKIIIR